MWMERKLAAGMSRRGRIETRRTAAEGVQKHLMEELAGIPGQKGERADVQTDRLATDGVKGNEE